MDLSELDAQLDDLQRVVGLSIECCVREVLADIVGQIQAVILPDIIALLQAVPEEQRPEVTKRYRRVRDLLDKAEAALDRLR